MTTVFELMPPPAPTPSEFAQFWATERRDAIEQHARPNGLRWSMAKPMVELVEKRIRQAEFARNVGWIAYAMFLEGQVNELNGRTIRL